ncbi:unnamed protein product, partial [Prorocentrum cordatum]
FVEPKSEHGPKFFLGDFSSKLHYRTDGEHVAVGEHVLLCPGTGFKDATNRHLPVECPANTILDSSVDGLATRHSVDARGQAPPVSVQTHSKDRLILLWAGLAA